MEDLLEYVSSSIFLAFYSMEIYEKLTARVHSRVSVTALFHGYAKILSSRDKSRHV